MARLFRQLFAFAGEPKGAACPAPLGDPPGHPTTRPFGFAALLGLAGAGRTRLCEPQTGCRPISCQPCATRPRKRGLGPCMLHVGLTRFSTACRGRGACDVLRRPSLPGCPCTITVLVSPSRHTTTFRFYLSRVTACPLPRPPLLLTAPRSPVWLRVCRLPWPACRSPLPA